MFVFKAPMIERLKEEMFERLEVGYFKKQVKEESLKKYHGKCSRKRAKNDVSAVRVRVRKDIMINRCPPGVLAVINFLLLSKS